LDKQKLSEATALIYDPVRGNMLLTRSVLHGIGFRKIEGITSLREVSRRLKDIEISVLIVEATDQPRQIVDLLRAQRLGELGVNPFIPIIATLWAGQTDLVADLMNCGCDDVLLRPFSAAQTLERITSIIMARKSFVVTSDYVGPDRGKVSPIGMNPEKFDPPNALRDRVLSLNCDPVVQTQTLQAARRRVDQDRLAKLARRIAMAAEVTIQAQGQGDSSSGFIVDLLESSAELVRAAKRLDQDEVQDIAVVLENVVARAASPGPERVENAQLTRQLALALFVAYAAEGGEQFRAELDQTLLQVRARLDRAKERAVRRHKLALSMAS
jgi:DNA-binding response OmpR family regulator